MARGGKGRPSLYSPELAERICQAIASSPYGLARICRERDDLPSDMTIMRWLDKEENASFREQYAQACARRADLLFDQMIDIADDNAEDGESKRKGDHQDVHATEQVARSKLRVDTRKWMASKLAPKKYGEKVALVGGSEGDNPLEVVSLTHRDRAKALAALVAKQAKG